MTAEATPGPHVYSVGEVVAGLRGLLEERVGRIWMVGEISNLHRAASGHVYFSLIDDTALLRAALFRAAARRLDFEPEDGLEVLVYGEVTVYPERGELQVVVRHLEPRGEGALRLAFEQLRRRLEAEGLFAQGIKRPLPERPTRIGVVTSATGAALHDVLEVTGRRHPELPIRIATTRVQGPGADHEIAAALAGLAEHGDVSLVLLVRGGGSLEDLQAFNTEVVARAIRACPVPVLCGVGHEIDVTIADLAADLRAPTPSAAAELAVPDRAALRDALRNQWRRLGAAARLRLDRSATRLARERDALRTLAPTARLAAQRARWNAASRALERGISRHFERARARFGERAGKLDTLSPLAVLGRGYALVRRERDGAIVRNAQQVSVGERLAIRLAEGRLEAAIEAVDPLPKGQFPN